MRKLAVLLIVLSLVLPHVSATELTCQKTLPSASSDMYCNLTGQGNLSVRVVAFDGLTLKDYSSYGHWEKVNGKRVADLNPITEQIPLRPNSTATMEITIWNVMVDAISEIGLDNSHNWIFNGKRNYMTFEIAHANGTVERKTVEVFIKGEPYVPVKLDKKTKGLFAFFFLTLIAGFITWLRRRSRETVNERRKFPKYKPSRWNYLSGLFTILWLAFLIAPWVLYYLGTPTNYYGDLRLYLSAIPLAVFTLWFLVDWSELKLRNTLYSLKNPPVTGLEWVPFSAFVIDIDIFPLWWAIGLIAFYINRHEKLNSLMRLAGLISPLWAFHLAETFGGDAVFMYSLLALAVIYIALINSVVMNAPERPEKSPEVEGVLRKPEGVVK